MNFYFVFREIVRLPAQLVLPAADRYVIFYAYSLLIQLKNLQSASEGEDTYVMVIREQADKETDKIMYSVITMASFFHEFFI